MNKYLLALLILLAGCASTNKEQKVNVVTESFFPYVWVEKNSKTGWFDLILNTQSKPRLTIVTSKFKMTKPIRSTDGELLAYISYENKQKPVLYIQNIYSAKRDKLEVLLDETSRIKFNHNEKTIIVKTNDVSKEIQITKW